MTATPLQLDEIVTLTEQYRLDPSDEAARDEFWGEVFRLPAWYFLHRGELEPNGEPRTYGETYASGRHLLVYTHPELARDYARAAGLADADQPVSVIESAIDDAALHILRLAQRGLLAGMVVNRTSAPDAPTMDAKTIPAAFQRYLHRLPKGVAESVPHRKTPQSSNFEAVISMLRHKNAPDMLEQIMAQLLVLPEWVFISQPGKARMPVIAGIEGRQTLLAFSDDVQAQKGAAQFKIERADGTVGAIRLPIAEVLRQLPELRAAGVEQIYFNAAGRRILVEIDGLLAAASGRG